jgi:hypothetical protein
MALVSVFAFTHAEEGNDKTVHEPRKATRETIRRIQGTPIESSKEDVDESELDRDGFYPKKKPTGAAVS